MKRIMISILLVMMFASQLMAEPATFVDNNAALRYLMAIGFMPKLSDKTADRLMDLNSLEALKELKPEARKELTSDNGFMLTILRLLDLAADCTQSTFIVDQDYDYNSIIPPYRTIRLFARFVNARGWLDAEKGDHVAAAKKFVHVFRLGVNLGNDGPVINSMVGVGIQRMAVESINNLLKLNNNAEVKKILNDYFADLKKPVFDNKVYINNEKRFIDNSLVKAEKTPEIFAHMDIFTDESTKPLPVQSSPDKACAANQRVLLGAIEMYLMDHEDAAEVKDSQEFIKILVDQQYLKSAPVCGNKGQYNISPSEEEGYYDVSCSCGVSPDTVSTQAQEAKEPEFSPEVIKKVNDYLKSDAYVSDKKELAEIFAEMLQIDPYTPEGDAKAGKLAERIENNTSKLVKNLVLNPRSFYKSLRENQQRIDELVDTLKK